jgi:predicted  nucleic acid-binding Zn-ribbon protein
VKADPTRQLRLLDLQALDTKLAQLDHRLGSLPEHAKLEELGGRVADLDAEAVRARTALDDVQREIAKAEADVQLVRDRAARNQQRLDTGAGSAKDMQALQHELDSLARRQSTLEDEELEVMERAETLQAEVAEVEQRIASVTAETEELTAARDEKVGAIEAERATVAAGRADLVIEVGEDLVALYEKVRTQSGTGAAPLVQRRCGGCQLELNTVEIGRIRAAAEDEVLRCEECRRILVRTPESGI